MGWNQFSGRELEEIVIPTGRRCRHRIIVLGARRSDDQNFITPGTASASALSRKPVLTYAKLTVTAVTADVHGRDSELMMRRLAESYR